MEKKKYIFDDPGVDKRFHELWDSIAKADKKAYPFKGMTTKQIRDYVRKH